MLVGPELGYIKNVPVTNTGWNCFYPFFVHLHVNIFTL